MRPRPLAQGAAEHGDGDGAAVLKQIRDASKKLWPY
jgi:hypothetical protein